ncbi:MAG: hypothetical protein ACD_11C00026G0011 [uncultured bacterium]|nr:MAG: hypothetical protein ACD_11C00026G0011 [uncultured bacterium]HBR72055.1 hypothetical protein [Candidatus Moranbacteria bacterium]
MTALIVLSAVSVVSIDKAQAAESPMQFIKEFTQEKLQKTKKIKIENWHWSKKAVDQPIKETKNFTIEKKKTKTHLEQVEEAVDFASKKTGVRKDFLMGMLVVESDLGRSTGDCSYKEVEEGAEAAYQNGQLGYQAYNTFIQRREIIKNLAESIGRDYEKVRVSCNPTRYAGTGGAMGIPQFMPDIWMLYKDKISEIVEKENPDPWNVKDGIVAMALLLSDTYGVKQHDHLAERNAAKMYLSGTTSGQYDWYANQIQYWSKNYKRLLG